MNTINDKKGYLDDNFKIFLINDRKDIEFEYHHHDFNKIIIFLGGKVSYYIEGKRYDLKKSDLLFISNNEIHKPVISPDENYSRIVIWINKDFLNHFNNFNNKNENLSNCFEMASAKKDYLVETDDRTLKNIKLYINKIIYSNDSDLFGGELFNHCLFVELMITLNRIYLKKDSVAYSSSEILCDEIVQKVLDYIENNISNDLSIDKIASKLYVSKYYLMRKFKAQVGTSIHHYVIQKRLVLAKNLIKNGELITHAAVQCGFNDYSSFVRAFKSVYKMSPKQFKDEVYLFNDTNTNE
ncbi:MAG: AraC family transcriptional regulator [Clostridioides sp.]|jgi:AraC-like DNA-binding protein|nr:AraC family transcriptional regulator [Clostridioides sp.]